MRIRFKVNLGSHDAEPLGLAFGQCQQGAEIEVETEAGEWLISRGIAERLEAKPRQVVGVSQRPAIAESQAPAIQPATSPGSKSGKHKEN